MSLITVRQARRDLELEGLIVKRAAKPAVIALPALRKPAIDFESLATIAAPTQDRRLEIFSYRRESAPLAAKTFGLAPGERLHCLRALLYARDQPACRCTFFFPSHIGRQLRRRDFDDVVVFRSVQRALGIKLSGARISVRAAQGRFLQPQLRRAERADLTSRCFEIERPAGWLLRPIRP